MHVIEVATGKVSTVDVIPGAKYAHASWTPKGEGFYYTRLPVDPKIPVDARPGFAEVYFHTLGTDPAKDVLVHEKTGDPTTFLGGGISRDGRYLFADVSHGWSRNDVWFRDLKGKSKDWTPLAVGKDALYGVEAHKGRFYLTTNEGAPKYHVFVVDPAHPERDAWKEIVPERQDATLSSADIVGGDLVLSYMKDVTTRIELHDLGGKMIRELALPTLGSAYLGGDPDQDEAYWSFETYNYPDEIHVTSIKKGGDAALVQAEGAGRPDHLRGGAGVLSVEGWNPHPHVRGSRQDLREGRQRTGDGHGLRRVQLGRDAALREVGRAVAGAWRHLRVHQPARRVGVRRGLAPCRHAPREAARVRRLRGGGQVPGEGEVDQRRPARHRGRLERRSAHRRRGHPEARAVPRGDLRRAAARHGPLRTVRLGAHLERRVRDGRKGRRFQGALRLLAVPPRHAGHGVPLDPGGLGRQRRSRGPHARPQVRGRAPGRVDRRARSCCASSATRATAEPT